MTVEAGSCTIGDLDIELLHNAATSLRHVDEALGHAGRGPLARLARQIEVEANDLIEARDRTRAAAGA